MRSETTNAVHVPRTVKNGEVGTGAAGAGSPAGSPSQEPRSGGMSPEIERKWSEFNEEKKTAYIIEITDAVVDTEEDMVTYTRIRMEDKYYPIYPYGNYTSVVWELEWDGGDRITISARNVHDSWNGTGSEWIGRVIVEVALPETPWFYRYEELADTIEKHGVRQTMVWILKEVQGYAGTVLNFNEGEEE